jgi:hypothetical protein
MASKQDELSHLSTSLEGLRKTYTYWRSKPSTLVSAEVCYLIEDAIEVIENIIKRHRTPEGVN